MIAPFEFFETKKEPKFWTPRVWWSGLPTPDCRQSNVLDARPNSEVLSQIPLKQLNTIGGVLVSDPLPTRRTGRDARDQRRHGKGEDEEREEINLWSKTGFGMVDVLFEKS